jgi:CRP-like cAMP-binding protein
MSRNIADLFDSLPGRDRQLAPGAFLFHMGAPVSSIFIVRSGAVELVRHQADGNALILQRAGPGEVLAEASLFSERYHCDALARSAAVVKAISKRRLRDRFRDDPAFAEAWAVHLGREIQNTRLRSEILSLKTVAARLDAWQEWHGALPARGEWHRIAREIGVSPEAFYREMAKRRG